MKNILTPILALLLGLLVVGCGETTAVVTESPKLTQEDVEPITETTPAAEHESVIFSEPVATPKPEPDPPEAQIEWIEKTHTVTDNDGYTYEVTLRLSPWILYSNTEVLSTAWDEVGSQATLPTFNDWGMRKTSDSEYYLPYQGGGKAFFCLSCNGTTYHMTDMYFCVGSVTIKNTTTGWDITSSSTRSFQTYLCWKNGTDKDWGWARSFGKIFYSNGKTSTTCNGIIINPLLHSNVWGPVPFVIMIPENFSPNTPNGTKYEVLQNGGFNYESWGSPNSLLENDFRVGIIGKDGVYVPPLVIEP